MSLIPKDNHGRIVVDSIHGDIPLNDREWRIVDTASFQRLRYIKQLAMAHLVYPNATHTRLAHSIGALRIMQRIIDCARRSKFDVTEEQENNLRMAALLHDVGHYPYSHLMEGIDKVTLIEEFVTGDDSKKRSFSSPSPYPSHVRCSFLAVTTQQDLIKAIGGKKTARAVAELFSRTGAADPQLSKLVSSSLDMDRLDYLLRDARAVGVPYGEIDLNYILNSFRISKAGVIGIAKKALPAAEHFLFARFFMTRTVYQHKTVCAFEEAARHMIRRIRDRNAIDYDLPFNGDGVEKRVSGQDFKSFTDSFLDGVMRHAATHDDNEIVHNIALSLLERRPPKLLHEVVSLDHTGGISKSAATFEKKCRVHLGQLAKDHEVSLLRFIFCKTKPLTIEKRQSNTEEEIEDDLLRVFEEQGEPQPIVGLKTSIVSQFAASSFAAYRLYIIDDTETDEGKYNDLCEVVRSWDAE